MRYTLKLIQQKVLAQPFLYTGSRNSSAGTTQVPDRSEVPTATLTAVNVTE
jgi:hypothetical protein